MRAAPPRRRNRDPLGPRAHERRRAAPSQKSRCYLAGCRALFEQTTDMQIRASRSGAAAQRASREVEILFGEDQRVANMNLSGAGLAEARRWRVP